MIFFCKVYRGYNDALTRHHWLPTLVYTYRTNIYVDITINTGGISRDTIGISPVATATLHVLGAGTNL